MTFRRDIELKVSRKLEILYNLFNGKPISPFIDEMQNQEVVELQKFVWDKAVEFGIKVRGKQFNRKEITRKMTPTPNYQRKMGCTERVYYCKGTHCISSNPACARKKIKEHVDVMAEVIQGYINHAKKAEGLE